MKNAYIATYPPRQCGIGTFTQDLYEAMNDLASNRPKNKNSYIVAINDSDEELQYPEEVKITIQQNVQEDYLAAAKYINRSGADCCILQHEFGIFGGQDGIYILPLLHKLNIPIIVTLHTVVENPSYNQKEAIQNIGRIANRIVVMSHKAIEMLVDIYKIPRDKIAFIEHGVPDIQFIQEEVKKEFKVENKKILFTFGLVGRNKGIETAIKALPKVVEKHPELLYVVLGKTHPNILKHSGEEYRLSLLQLISDLGLENNVVLQNEFATKEQLFKYLYAADIYITPYLNEAQITSGTLSYAVGAGLAVVSTPYWHAAELLSEDKGMLYDFGDTEALSNILIELLENDEKRLRLRANAKKHGYTTTWPQIGAIYNELVEKVAKENVTPIRKEDVPFDISLMPEFSMRHIVRLTDRAGIIQHANYAFPNLKEGYCLCDNSRALFLALKAYKIKKDKNALKLCTTYVSFIDYMQRDDGNFRNFLSFGREYLDEVGSEDSFGRAVWAIGFMIHNPPNNSFRQMGLHIFHKAVPHFKHLESPRSIANTMIGISYYMRSFASDEGMMQLLKELANKLVYLYNNSKDENWKWYEKYMTYDNALLPLAMLHAAEILNDAKVGDVAWESTEFLTKITLRQGYLSVIGNEEWFHKDNNRSVFAQQPVDAMSMVLMFGQAYKMTKDKSYLKKLFVCYRWFLGANDLRMSLYNHETQGCFDGIEEYGVNQNQGAESTIAYLISHLNVLKAYEDYYLDKEEDN